MRWFALPSLFFASLVILACGSKANPVEEGPLSGNWEITLLRISNPTPETYSGFLQQSGNSISGALILGGGCSGVGPVSGTVSGQNFQLEVGEFGQDLSLTGTLPPGGPASSTLLSGAFSSLAGGCVTHPSSGSWSAVQVTPIAGSFKGTITTSLGTLDVTGVLNQGPNTGASTANLSGTITAQQSGTPFCSYLTTATITGLISGTAVTLNLYGPDGSLISQVPATVSPNGTSLSCSALQSRSCFSFPEISSGCTGGSGEIQLSFQ